MACYVYLVWDDQLDSLCDPSDGKLAHTHGLLCSLHPQPQQGLETTSSTVCATLVMIKHHGRSTNVWVNIQNTLRVPSNA